MARIDDDVLEELKELLEFAINNRDWYTVTEVYELLCETMGVEPFATEEEDEEEY